MTGQASESNTRRSVLKALRSARFTYATARRKRDFDCGYAAALVEMNHFVRQHFKKVVPKRRFESEGEAARFLETHDLPPSKIYQCALCEGWHTATVRAEGAR